MENTQKRLLMPRVGRFKPDKSPASKRQRTAIACTACREKKTACNGGRPNCSACCLRASQCIYLTKDNVRVPALTEENQGLKGRNAALEELLGRLLSAPEADAFAILQRLRSTQNRDPLSILNDLGGNGPIEQLGTHAAARGVLPHMSSVFEFELLARHPNAYRTLNLSEDAVMSVDTWVTGNHGGLAASFPVEGTVSYTFGHRLLDLDISYWTAIDVTNEYARGAILQYLDNDHPSIGVFDAQLFLDDLVDNKSEFCSPFLVSALLAFASQAYAIKDRSASTRSYEFEKEAARLFDLEKEDSLTLISGLALLSYSYGAHGQTTDGSAKYVAKILEMGQRMRLFGTSDTKRSRDLQALSVDQQRATLAAAWGGFNTVILLSLFYVVKPTAYPPSLPTPGSINISTTNGLEPNVWEDLDYNAVIPFLCKLWSTLSDILHKYRHEKSHEVVSLTFAHLKYRELLTLADELPNYMVRQDQTSSHALFYHIVYHTAVLETFRPFIPPNKTRGVRSFTACEPFPEAIFAASVKQLKGVILEYTSQHLRTKDTVFWSGIGLMRLVNAVLKDLMNPDWRYYLALCINSYQKLFPAFAICEGIVQSLLAMAVECNAITTYEARSMAERFRHIGDYHTATIHSKGAFVVDYDLAVKDRRLAVVETWVDKFNEIDVFSEFTDGII